MKKYLLKKEYSRLEFIGVIASTLCFSQGKYFIAVFIALLVIAFATGYQIQHE